MAPGTTRRLTAGFLGAAALSGLVVSDPAVAQQAAGGTTMLDEIQVEGRAADGTSGPASPSGETARGPVNGYVATRSSVGAKTDTPIRETPRSVEVIGRKELEDRAVTTMPEAVLYSPGVTTNSAGFDPRFDQIYIRGFPVNTFGDYRDGLRQMQGQFAAFRTEPFTLERIDILKGPASVLYGQTTPGGVVDRISKRPTETPRFEAFTQYKDTDRLQTGLDLSGPLNTDKTVLGRFIALGRVGDTDFDIKDQRFLLNPSLTWAPTDATKLTVYGLFQKDETDSNVAVLNARGSLDTLPIRASDPSYDHLKQSQYQAGLEFEHEFNDQISLRQNTRYNYLDLSARYLTGGVTGGGWQTIDGKDVYRRGAFAIDETVEAVQSDTQLESRFTTGALEHTLLAGLDYQWSKSSYGSGTGPADPRYDLDPENYSYGLDGPTPAVTSVTDITLRQFGLYAQDQIKSGGWRLTLGLRHDWAERSIRNERFDGGAPTAPGERNDEAWSYNVGLLYAFENGLSPYVSYATSFLPSSTRGQGGVLLKPTEGEQAEVGVKFQPPGTESLFTAAGYHVVEKNAAKYDAACACSIAVGEIETYGLELGAKINLTENFNINAGYNLNDAEITKDITATNVGNRPLSTPKHTASLWADYTIHDGPLMGVGLGAGVRYVGKAFANNGNTLENDAYAVFDAALRYDLGKASPALKGVSLALNSNNLTDKSIVVCDSSRCYLSEGRTVTATLRYRW